MEEDDLYDGYNDFNSAFDTDVKFLRLVYSFSMKCFIYLDLFANLRI